MCVLVLSPLGSVGGLIFTERAYVPTILRQLPSPVGLTFTNTAVRGGQDVPLRVQGPPQLMRDLSGAV